MRARLSFFLLLLAAFTTQGQSLKFDVSERDFKKVDFKDSLVASFSFTNTSGRTVRIAAVESDCGCAVLSYPKWDIVSNEKGLVKITYLPYKYGKFHKQFMVRVEGDTKGQYLTLKGDIRAPENTERKFIHPLGPFLVANKFFSFGKITNEKPVTKRFEFYNPTDTNLVLTGEMKLPPHLKVFFDDVHIAPPKEVLPIFITFDPKVKDDLGFVEDNIQLNRHTASGNKPLNIRIIATIEEYFPPLTEEVLAEMPELSLSFNTVNLGSVQQGDNKITRFILTNTGVRPLKIKKIATDDGCEVLSSPSVYGTLAAGESVNLQVQFKDLGQTGTVSRFLTLFTNDPRHTREMLEVKAYVKKSQ